MEGEAAMEVDTGADMGAVMSGAAVAEAISAPHIAVVLGALMWVRPAKRLHISVAIAAKPFGAHQFVGLERG